MTATEKRCPGLGTEAAHEDRSPQSLDIKVPQQGDSSQRQRPYGDVAPLTEHRRMRRPRAEFIAGCRRDRGAPLAPEPAADPSTFGLGDDELRSHANELYRSGWSMAEILAVLAVAVAG